MDSRIVYVLCASLLTVSAIAQQFVGFPRPWWQFVLLVLPLCVLLAHTVISQSLSWSETVATLGLTTVTGAWLRLSGYLSLVSAGRDTQMWLAETRNALATGTGPTGGMYGASPLHIIDLTIGVLIYGVDLFGTRHVTIASASTVPILLFAITWRLAHERRPALVTAILTATFPLFVRTAPLIEGESAALSWFATVLLLLVISLLDTERRTAYLTMGLLVCAAYLHFFYATVFAVWTLGVGIVFALSQSVIGPRVGIDIPKPAPIWIALPALVFIPFHILWSGWGAQGAGVLVGLLNVTLPADPLSAFLPSEGAAGTSVGSGGSGSEPWYAPVVSLGSVAAYLLFATVGGVLALQSLKARESQVAIAGAATMILMTVGITVAGIGYNLHFRLFYFVGVFVVIFAAVAIISLADRPRIRERRGALALLCCVVALAMIGSPMGAMANNIDSPVSNGSWGLTQDDYEQAAAIHTTAGIGESSVGEVRPDHLFGSSDDTGRLSAEPCDAGNHSVADTGQYTLCEDGETANATG